jgi:hypothetical protein
MSHTGGAIIVGKVDDHEVKEYSDKIRALSLQEFYDLVVSKSTSKSWEAYRLEVRKKVLLEYYLNWVVSSFNKGAMQLLGNSMVKNILDTMDDTTFRVMRDRWQFPRAALVNVLIHKVRTWCVVLHVQKKGVKRHTNYGYIYGKLINKTVPVFCTLGPDMESSDGEYRNKFNTIANLMATKTSFIDLYDDIEEYVSNRTGVTYTQDYYIPPSHVGYKEVQKTIRASRLVNDIMTLAWFSAAFQTYLKILPSHTNTSYKLNMSDKSDNRFLKELSKRHGADTLVDMFNSMKYLTRSNAGNHTNYGVGVSCGQKIIPITNKGVQSIGDTSIPVWSEINILRRVTDLYLNNITSGIGAFHEWFFIYGANRHLFDNDTARTLDNSDDDTVIINSLIGLAKHGSEVKYADNNNMSDIGVCLVMECTGRTVYNIADLMNSPEYAKNTGSLYSCKARSAKHVFEVVYTLMCMYGKLGIIHGDLHLNNVTMKKSVSVDEPSEGKRHELYIIDGDVFAWRTASRNSVIIDFSRSMMIPPDSDMSATLLEQYGDNILNYYKILLPQFYSDNRETLETAVVDQFNLVYKVFAAVDMYMFSQKTLVFVSKYKKQLSTCTYIVKLMEKINKIALFYLTTAMLKHITDKTPLSKIRSPNRDILYKCFSQAIVPDISKVKAHSVYHYNTTMRYSYLEWETLPPMFKHRKIKKDGYPEYIDISDRVTPPTRRQVFNDNVEINKKVESQTFSL